MRSAGHGEVVCEHGIRLKRLLIEMHERNSDRRMQYMTRTISQFHAIPHHILRLVAETERDVARVAPFGRGVRLFHPEREVPTRVVEPCTDRVVLVVLGRRGPASWIHQRADERKESAGFGAVKDDWRRQRLEDV